jgi:hypothetical protein
MVTNDIANISAWYFSKIFFESFHRRLLHLIIREHSACFLILYVILSLLFNLSRKLSETIIGILIPKHEKHLICNCSRAISAYNYTNVSHHRADLYENPEDILWPRSCQEFGENRRPQDCQNVVLRKMSYVRSQFTII